MEISKEVSTNERTSSKVEVKAKVKKMKQPQIKNKVVAEKVKTKILKLSKKSLQLLLQVREMKEIKTLLPQLKQ